MTLHQGLQQQAFRKISSWEAASLRHAEPYQTLLECAPGDFITWLPVPQPWAASAGFFESLGRGCGVSPLDCVPGARQASIPADLTHRMKVGTALQGADFVSCISSVCSLQLSVRKERNTEAALSPEQERRPNSS